MSGAAATAERKPRSGVPYFQGDPRTPGHHHTELLPVVDSPTDTLCVENIPKFITPGDFLGHIAEQRDNLLGIRALGCPSNKAQYLLVLQLARTADARALAEAHHGRPFSALGSETMYINFVKRDPTPAATASSALDTRDGHHPLVRVRHHMSPGDVCPVCLESLYKPMPQPDATAGPTGGVPVGDEVSDDDDTSPALFTTMCGHTAHLSCFLQTDYEGAGCTVCRFNPSELGHKCSDPSCSEGDSLWMCLVCGHLGCGRYHGGHAEAHYRGTSHTYCMDVHTGQVWDYAGDNFIHRLISNEDDMKVVQSVPGGAAGAAASPSRGYSESPPATADDQEMDDVKLESKVESVSDSYSRLLEVQLDTQNAYYAQVYEAERAVQRALEAEIAAAAAPLTHEASETPADAEEGASGAAAATPAAHAKTMNKQRKKLADEMAKLAQRRDDLGAAEALKKQHTVGVERYRQQYEAMSKAHAQATAQKQAQLASLRDKISELMTALCD